MTRATKDVVLESGLPSNLDAERAVLGAVLLDNATWPLAEVSAEDFSHDANRRLWRHMAALREEQSGIDAVTLTDSLTRTKELDAAGGVKYLASLTEGLPRSVNVAHYARIVREKARLRSLIRAAHRMMAEACEQQAKAKDIIASAQNDLEAIGREEGERAFASVDEVPGLEAVRNLEIEWACNHFIPADSLSILAGTPGAMKSWLALDLSRAVVQGDAFARRGTMRKRVLYLDRENPEAIINARKRFLETGAPKGLHYWGLWIKERPANIWDRRLIDFCRLKRPLVVVDSLIRFIQGSENDAEQMARMTWRLRELVAAGATVLAIHHKSDKPGAPDYRGSSELKAACDALWTVEKQEGAALKLICLKMRCDMEAGFSLRLERGGFVPMDQPVRKSAVAAFGA